MTPIGLILDGLTVSGRVQSEREQLAEAARRQAILAVLPPGLGWIFYARLLWMLGSLSVTLYDAPASGDLSRDMVFEAPAQVGGAGCLGYTSSFEAELVAGWVLGNLSDGNFVALLAGTLSR